MKQNYAELSNLSGRVVRGLTNGSVASVARTVAMSAVFLWSVIAVGIALRVTQYLADRSLWGDEGALALNLIQKPVGDLLKPLDYLQGAPTGFLLAEKAIVEVLGDDELALRLVPLACGILSLFLFAAVARRVLEPTGAACPLVLFATADLPVYYSSEVKQYSVDVAATLVLFYGALAIDWRTARAWQVGLAGVAAGVVVWFSHAALIVLPALALALLVTYALSRDTRAFRAVLAASAVGGIPAAAAYLVNHKRPQRRQRCGVQRVRGRGWARSIGRSTPRSLACVCRAGRGCAYSYRSRSHCLCARRNCSHTSQPAAGPHGHNAHCATLVASTLDLYPFGSRFILFLVPFFLLLVGAGLEVLMRPQSRAAPFGVFADVLLVLSYPIARAATNLVNPPGHEELKAVLGEVQARWQPGDALYVWYQSQYPFRYYAECSDCDVLEDRGPAEVVAARTPSKTPTRLRHILRVCSSVAPISRFRILRATSHDSEAADVRGSCSPRPGTMSSFGTRSTASERDSRSSGQFARLPTSTILAFAPRPVRPVRLKLLRRDQRVDAEAWSLPGKRFGG